MEGVEPPRFHRPFSNVLLGVGLLCLVLAGASLWLIEDITRDLKGLDAERVVLAVRLVQCYEGFVGLGFIVAGILRLAGNRWGGTATVAILIPSLLLVPIGPVMFLWYVLGVRKEDGAFAGQVTGR